MINLSVCILFALLAFTTVRCARLRVVEAGKSGRLGPYLEDGFKLCVHDFGGDRGISVECKSEEAKFVLFSLNGNQVRREEQKPFLIAGDSDGEVFEWKPPSGSVTIECVGKNDEHSLPDVKRVSGTFDCGANAMKPEDSAMEKPSTTPTSVNKVEMVVREAEKMNGKASAPLQSNFKFCPRDFASSISLECVAPSASKAEMIVNGEVVRNEGTPPFMIAGDQNGNAFPWVPPMGTVTVGCRTSTGSVSISGRFECDSVLTPPPAASKNVDDDTDHDDDEMESPTAELAPRVGESKSYCVLIPAQTHMNSASDEWMPEGMALTYRPTSTFGGTVGPNHAPLRYMFTVPVPSHYFIALDSETPDRTEHNDAWIQFDSVTLRRDVDGEIMAKDSTSKPLKAYQNSGGRFTGAFSVDHEPHSFATSQVLQPETTYTIVVSARSTMFKLYGIIMFPCAEEECLRFSQHTHRYAELCKF